VQIIGFDPDTDFSIMPWIAESYSGTVQDGDVVVGAKIGVPESGRITFYGQEYTIAARLKETGTGLDNAVFANMNTVRKMAVNASSLLKTSPFQGVDIDTAASALLIKVADGYSIEQVTDDINIHITKVKATPAKSMISDLSEGLTGTSALIGIMAAVIWAMAVIILVIVFALLSNERKKEFAVLRVMGASRKMLSRIMGMEAAVLGAIGAIIGIVLSVLAVFPLSGSIRDMLKLPFFMPDLWVVLLLAAGAFLISVSASVLTALLSAKKITTNDTALLLREDT
jgi:putative ABC transport system permease protein